MRHRPHPTPVAAAPGQAPPPRRPPLGPGAGDPGGRARTRGSPVVLGAGSPGGDVVTDVSPQDFPITAATADDPVDQAARNALTDLSTFWGQAYPDAYGEDFAPLRGGIYSVDLDSLDTSQ